MRVQRLVTPVTGAESWTLRNSQMGQEPLRRHDIRGARQTHAPDNAPLTESGSCASHVDYNPEPGSR
jgi:hypothetical protein